MFCKNCGKEIKDTEKFCPNCGEPVVSEKNKESEKNQTQILQTGKKNKKFNPKIVVILLLMVAIIFVAVKLFGGNSSKEQLEFNLTVVNNTGVDIYRLYASETNTDNWEEDILGDDILYAGEQFLIVFTITEGNMDWDFAIEDSQGNMLEFYDLSFAYCDVDGATLVLDYDGEEATASLY